MCIFDSESFYRNEGAELIHAMASKDAQLRRMVEEYIGMLATQPNLVFLAQAVGGFPLQRRPVAEQAEAVASEARAAIATFLAGDWATVTRIGCILLNNAFQSADPAIYEYSDTELLTVYQKGVGLLSEVLKAGFTGTGLRLAMECDRPPQVSTSDILSATERDWFLQWVARHPGQNPNDEPNPNDEY